MSAAALRIVRVVVNCMSFSCDYGDVRGRNEERALNVLTAACWTLSGHLKKIPNGRYTEPSRMIDAELAPSSRKASRFSWAPATTGSSRTARASSRSRSTTTAGTSSPTCRKPPSRRCCPTRVQRPGGGGVRAAARRARLPDEGHFAERAAGDRGRARRCVEAQWERCSGNLERDRHPAGRRWRRGSRGRAVAIRLRVTASSTRRPGPNAGALLVPRP